MIQLPRRSVTRFFIPLIDVLTLLFCIFLLMPYVQNTSDTLPGTESTVPEIPEPAPPPDADDPERSLLSREERDLQRLRMEKIETLQERLALRVLEIDADTGKLYYYEPEQRVEIATQAEARTLIERQRREAAGKELYYLFLFPRRVTGFPLERQIKQYERWFEGVAHGIDNPRGGR